MAGIKINANIVHAEANVKVHHERVHDEAQAHGGIDGPATQTEIGKRRPDFAGVEPQDHTQAQGQLKDIYLATPFQPDLATASSIG